MGLTGIDIFKITPKTNCKDCGCPTCMAFAMKVAQGGLKLEQCPHLSADVMAQMAEATAPPMKTIKTGTGKNEHTLGGETVLFRHEKTLVSRNLFAMAVCNAMEDADNEKVFANIGKVDYERIGERMYVEFIFVNYVKLGGEEKYMALVEKAAKLDRAVILGCADADVAKKALEATKGLNPILLGANKDNYEAMNALAKEYNVVLGVTAEDLDELYDTTAKLEALGNKNLILDAGVKSVKEAFGNAVQIRRAALKHSDRTFGYPSIIRLNRLAQGDVRLQAALAAVFTIKYGSILVMDEMTYAEALPLYGLRQNIYTDPQKPMRVTPGIYKLNGADENAICALTVDFALSYFVISGEMERSGVPINLIIPDAGGYSVLTSWAAGKLSAGTISKFFEEKDIAGQVKSRRLVIPGKVAVLKGELEEKLPGWEIIVGPKEALQAVKFFKDLK